MNVSSLVIPLLLSAVAVYGMGRKVDVYSALTHGAEEGLTVLLRIIEHGPRLRSHGVSLQPMRASAGSSGHSA